MIVRGWPQLFRLTRVFRSKRLNAIWPLTVMWIQNEYRNMPLSQPTVMISQVITLNVRGPSFLGLTMSISRLLMPWLLTSPGHQQPWYQLCRTCPGLIWGRILITCVISMRGNDIKCKYMFMFPLKNLARKGLIAIASWRHTSYSQSVSMLIRFHGFGDFSGAPSPQDINTLRPSQNSRHFADTFKSVFLNENRWISINISLQFVPKHQINNIPVLVQIMA